MPGNRCCSIDPHEAAALKAQQPAIGAGPDGAIRVLHHHPHKVVALSVQANPGAELSGCVTDDAAALGAAHNVPSRETMRQNTLFS